MSGLILPGLYLDRYSVKQSCCLEELNQVYAYVVLLELVGGLLIQHQQ